MYDATRGRYRYPFEVESIYYDGLWAILSERLLGARAVFGQQSEVLQHAMSLHTALLELQERSADGKRLGWRTGTINRALINTETTSLAVLALGAYASWVLEPGYEPLSSAAGNYRHEHETLSAVAGQSVPGHAVFGPFWTLEPGTYDVEFALRTPAARVESPLATLDVYDGATVVATKVIEGPDAPTGNQWRRYRLTAEITNASNHTEFRVFWHGAYDLDISSIRVTRAEPPSAVAVSTTAKSSWCRSSRGSACLGFDKSRSRAYHTGSIETYVK